MTNTFVIECLTKGGNIYYLDDEGSFDELTSPKLKKWKTQKGAEKYLESLNDRLKESYDLKVVERSKEIQAGFEEKESRRFEWELKNMRGMAIRYNVVNSGSVYRQMLLRRAEGLVALKEGDSVLYFSEGYTGSYQLVSVEKVGISTFSAGDQTPSRLTGDDRFLPNDRELVDYFVAYVRIQQFVSRNWEEVEPFELIRISTVLSDLG